MEHVRQGPVTADRQTRKDVFYLYSRFGKQDDTTVYITAGDSSGIARKEFSIKVYSNASGLTLYIMPSGSRRHPPETDGVVWTFSGLKLKEDTDVFRVVASDGTSDEVSLSRL